eukprot:1851521-Rhodomonas_salina.1
MHTVANRGRCTLHTVDKTRHSPKNLSGCSSPLQLLARVFRATKIRSDLTAHTVPKMDANNAKRKTIVEDHAPAIPTAWRG